MNKNYTHITIVLDRSGSMSIVKDDTIGAFNAFLDDQRKFPGIASWTLVQFDDLYEPLDDFVDIAKAKKLDTNNFVPRGMTALYDAVGKTIVSVGEKLAVMDEAERPAQVIFAILTDGHENASKEYKRDKVFEMVRCQEKEYNWQFVFLGAGQDAMEEGPKIGIPVAMCSTYSGQNIGTAVGTISQNVSSYRTTGDKDALSFTDDQRSSMK